MKMKRLAVFSQWGFINNPMALEFLCLWSSTRTYDLLAFSLDPSQYPIENLTLCWSALKAYRCINERDPSAFVQIINNPDSFYNLYNVPALLPEASSVLAICSPFYLNTYYSIITVWLWKTFYTMRVQDSTAAVGHTMSFMRLMNRPQFQNLPLVSALKGMKLSPIELQKEVAEKFPRLTGMFMESFTAGPQPLLTRAR
jgi:hypothetical protein